MATDTMEFLDSRLKAQAGDCTPSHDKRIFSLLAKIIKQNAEMIDMLCTISVAAQSASLVMNSPCDRRHLDYEITLPE